MELKGGKAHGCSLCEHQCHLMQAATGSREIKRAVMWALLCPLKTSRAAVFLNHLCVIGYLQSSQKILAIFQLRHYGNYALFRKSSSFRCCAVQTCMIKLSLKCVQLLIYPRFLTKLNNRRIGWWSYLDGGVLAVNMILQNRPCPWGLFILVNPWTSFSSDLRVRFKDFSISYEWGKI